MVAVAAEILSWELPVAGYYPLVYAADYLSSALSPIKESIEIPGGFPQVVQQRRRCGIKGGEEEALVAAQLGHWDEAPLFPVQLTKVSVLVVGHTHQATIVAVSPAVVGASKGGGVSAIRSAEPIPPMAAHIEKGIYPPMAIPNHYYRILAHVGGEEVSRLGDLGLMAEKQPAASKNLLQFLLVDVVLDVDASADQTLVSIYQVLYIP
jgi:hypothetical protein